MLPSTYAPEEDQGSFMAMMSGPEGASYEFMQKQLKPVEDHMMQLVESDDVQRLLLFVPSLGGSRFGEQCGCAGDYAALV